MTKKFFCSTKLFFSILVCLNLSAFSQVTITDIQELCDQGDFSAACSLSKKAYYKDTTVPQIALLYAKTCSNAAVAQDIYKQLTANSSTPDTIKSEAYFRLGCAAHVKGKYQKAASYMRKSISLSANNAASTSALFASLIHDTTDAGATTSLSLSAADKESYEGKLANFYLGLLYYKKKDFAQALPCFDIASESADTCFFECPALAGSYCCAVSLGRSAEASTILTRMKRMYPVSLEKTMTAKAKPVSQDKTATTAIPAVAKKDTAANASTAVQVSQKNGPVFSIQVGAFGSIDNAEALKSELTPFVSPVSIIATTVNLKPLYRVRAGTFLSKEKARAFADSTFTKKKLTFRIVEETAAVQ